MQSGANRRTLASTRLVLALVNTLKGVLANRVGTAMTSELRGRMVALQNGQYTTVPVDTCTQGLKRVDIEELYDSEQYRPKVRHVLGKPMFLY